MPLIVHGVVFLEVSAGAAMCTLCTWLSLPTTPAIVPSTVIMIFMLLGNQDVMVVVQCAPTPQLHTLPAAAAADEAIKCFASSVVESDKMCDAINYKSLPQDADQAKSSQKLMKQWRQQTVLMWVWLLSSLVVVLFVPLIMTPGALLLASLTASALGVISVIMHSLADQLTEAGEVVHRRRRITVIAPAKQAGILPTTAPLLQHT